MPKRGRPKKNRDPIDVERTQMSDDIVNMVKFNAKLNDEQIFILRRALDDTFKEYNMQKKETRANEEGLTVKDINAEALESFLNSKKSEGKSKYTIYNYGGELSKLFMIINKDYRDITAQDIRDFMEYRHTHDGLQMVTVQNIRLYLMSFYKWAQAEDRIIRNPMDKIGTIKTDKKVIDTFTDEEVEKLRCACKSERDLAIVDMLSSSGMRVSELCGLNRNSVNFETGEVKVYGKGSKERICFLTGRAKIHLKWYLDTRTDDNPALFVTAKSPYSRLSRNGVEFLIKHLGEVTGISDINRRCHPHKFRATLATNMINKGADVSDVQAILGHTDSSTTLAYYARMDNDTIHRAHTKYVG